MGLRGSKGLKYFPLVTDFFQDRDVRRLMLGCGEVGVLLYIYILCAIYSKSYYLKWDQDMLMDASIDLQCSVECLPPILDYLLDKGFFHRQLFEEKGLLSSKAVQRQFQECARVMRKKRVVDRQLWLLSEDETNSSVSFEDSETAQTCAKDDADCANTDVNCAKEGSNCAISTQRKGKEKEKKLNESERKGERPLISLPDGQTGSPQGGKPLEERIATAPEGPRNDSGGAAVPLLSQPAADSSPPEGGSLNPLSRGEAAPALPEGGPRAPVLDHYKEKIDLGGRGEEELREYCDALGQELCLFALERALEQDKPRWSYVRAILRSYKQQGYTQLSQARDEQERYRQSFARDNYGFKGRNVPASCKGYEPVNMEGLKKMYDLI